MKCRLYRYTMKEMCKFKVQSNTQLYFRFSRTILASALANDKREWVREKERLRWKQARKKTTITHSEASISHKTQASSLGENVMKFFFSFTFLGSYRLSCPPSVFYCMVCDVSGSVSQFEWLFSKCSMLSHPTTSWIVSFLWRKDKLILFLSFVRSFVRMHQCPWFYSELNIFGLKRICAEVA